MLLPDSVTMLPENTQCSQNHLKSLSLAVSCRDLPQIIDYIRVKADIGELEKKGTDWQRKIEIAGE